jgi:hypothetical protein
MIKMSEQELLSEPKRIGAKYNYAPEAVLVLAEAAVRFQVDALIPNLGPFPKEVDECDISESVMEDWPEWVGELLPRGSKWERLHWPDGSQTIRLIDDRGAVLAAKRTRPESAS